VTIRSGLVLLTFVYTAHAAELNQDTVKAWQEYVQLAGARMQARLRPGSNFLKIDERPDWVEKVRSGAIVVLPGGSHNPIKVPSGLIHDWFGSGFIAQATLKDVLPVVRDYDRYKEFYRPTVVDSSAHIGEGHEDRFSMVLTNASLFSRNALDSDFKCSYVRVDDQRWYSVSESTRIQEVESYGASEQRLLPEGKGSGFIWRLFSITRLEERDGGVYIELEAIALSRDIPVSLGWIVEPIVRRISRDSLTASIRQTTEAVRSEAAVASSRARGASYSATTTDPLRNARASSSVQSLR
jgi:hypothetical protein